MRQTFGKSVSVKDQLMRAAKAKEPGHKHQKRPGVKATERRNASAKRHEELQAIKDRKRRQRVAAFFRGEIDEYPK